MFLKTTFRKTVAVVLIFLFSANINSQVQAAALVDELLGVRLAEQITQSVLGSPPLPSLVEGTSAGVRPMVMPIFIDIDGQETYPGQATAYKFSGSGKGWGAGIGITQHTKNNFSLFGFTMVNSTNTSMKSTYDDATYVYFDDIKSQSYSFMGGFSYRLWSRKTFPVVMGILGGPFFSYYKSGLNFRPDTSKNYSYNSDVLMYGPMVGAQLFFTFVGMEFNPYFLSYTDVSNECEKYSTTSPEVPRARPETACPVAGEIELDGSFVGYGLNVGVLGLSFGAFSQLKVHGTSSIGDSVKVTKYSIAYNFTY